MPPLQAFKSGQKTFAFWAGLFMFSCFICLCLMWFFKSFVHFDGFIVVVFCFYAVIALEKN